MIVRNAPVSRMFAIAHRIADRFGPQVAAKFLAAVTRLQAGIDDVALRSALASGDLNAITAAVGTTRLPALFQGGDSLTELLRRVAAASGAASAEVLSGVTGIAFDFNAVDPRTVMWARHRAAALVVQIGEDVREAIRIITATGALEGLTVQQQAVAIRHVVGLPPNWANAPANLANELRAGQFTASRRLSATDKAQIRKRLREGTIDEAFIARMQERYAFSLTNRRALNIARTESLAASNAGMREGWRQAVDEGVLPSTARRNFIVTPDDRLRETHAAVPGMNPGGIPLDGMFQTPLGPFEGPPIETNCRCSEGLTFPGLVGVL
jgi:hypothetical protein